MKEAQQDAVAITAVAGGVLMIVIGICMWYGWPAALVCGGIALLFVGSTSFS